ncbi:hypothetical protein FM037_28090 [Shewanella psychropiezotolerans]|uniref:Uncharacterized protein n=1 Tax=Shewanella psychropiezotolerans TaxID=2593655 RepID=A0ABX5X582_9GAMM|nr:MULTISPECIES: hypothetical protein [Shewanella]MPY26326.1 hypothetical protein [Shewanella sp. YLB-07]QDO86429.1 hypothetical protein FM037_28090 [Shewanella psychropiezotolerans]
MKLTLCQFLVEKLNSAARFSNIGKPNLTLFLGSVFLLSLSDGLSVSVGGYVDISELVALSDGLFAECLGVSLFSLLINPLVIEILWRLIHLIFKYLNSLGLSNSFPVLSSPELSSIEHTAHGCRAPPA